ncbi:undecaprenyl-diphosphate phosphatase [Deinococcus multiflagellatus]|uniref:undecaprenyl-diphosphate phosphatase n=1 Tax=Deinococcus multiflagellatus TaxID=1656887 RepID=UPI001CCD11E9|nr:undecaprenyl-diphosphate phosphatase [Deinococcus multiflagellatus]MBZ9715702.1 undecaprenyl-diphosphate phosphatase [Deinococcus multiflagellatus]
MNDFIAAALLGLVEGITEFLPVSSTGHLIVAADLLNFRDAGGTFEIVIQLGAVLAVIVYYARDLLDQARALPTSADARRLWLGIALAFVPAAVLGLLFSDAITRYLFSPVTVAVSLMVGGVVLWWIEGRAFTARTTTLTQVTPRQALLVGCAQCLALVPGVSRSASSIIGGLLTGLDRPTATAFSFYLSIPTLGLATLYALVKGREALDSTQFGPLFVGLGVSFATALIVMGWLLRYVSRHDFRGFAVYRIVAGIAILGWALWR